LNLIHDVSALFSFVNVLLLLGLIWVYGNDFRKIRAQFTAGLLFFVALLLVQNLLTLYSFLAMFMYYAEDVGGFVLAYTIVQTAGLVVLLWLSLR
jgi:hypothetical protein